MQRGCRGVSMPLKGTTDAGPSAGALPLSVHRQARTVSCPRNSTTDLSEYSALTTAHDEGRVRELLQHLPGHRILVTGGCGFIGSALIRHLLMYSPASVHVFNLDTSEYCASADMVLGAFASTRDKDCAMSASVASASQGASDARDSHSLYCDASLESRYHFISGSILDATCVLNALRTYRIDVIVHMAAQTHVDNSFSNGLLFTEVNVVGTHTLLECACQYGQLSRFLHISTDEVYGETPVTAPPANEASTVLRPTNPYAATKAAAEHLVSAYYHSFKLPVLISRGNNVFGPGQYPEKVIPCFIVHALRQERLPIHGDGHHQRSFLYVDDVSRALCTILVHGNVGEVYNISSETELSVHEVARRVVACIAGGDHEKILTASRADFDASYVRYEADRAYNDARYCTEGEKLTALGWVQEVSFEEGLRRTVDWYRRHPLEAGGYWRGAGDAGTTAPFSDLL
ncbi:GDP-mannose 4,6 dehydratase, putative [Leishmania tarentolae]|uniref:GDP-mannose 4,6 dehydratase, putative n=1 Tax=Leishmania tarentolae TaxID=5689 RepID=A0A640KPY8_LEITA|nr:GDP-mannose 4,6 dehydratase, putative [Leishmania tarentolae]